MPVWDKIEDLANHFQSVIKPTAQYEYTPDSKYSWHNTLYSGAQYRRAHIEIVDKRESHGIYILHTTIFPHLNDPSPIFGFDAVCGKNKITGAFHDFSPTDDHTSIMYSWFQNQVSDMAWNKPRELPEWAQRIFSPAMVAAGNLQEESEINQLCKLAQTTLSYYLNNVGLVQQIGSNYRMAQNLYCHWQKQNPHVIKSMVAMGVAEDTVREFVDTVLFPEVV